jgi:hypothetical protein
LAATAHLSLRRSIGVGAALLDESILSALIAGRQSRQSDPPTGTAQAFSANDRRSPSFVGGLLRPVRGLNDAGERQYAPGASQE